MSFFEKMKSKVSEVSDKLSTQSLGLTKLIKEFKDFSHDIDKLSAEKQKYIEYLKTSEEYEKFTVPLAEKLENIDTSRKELAEKLNTECVAPLEELVSDWLELQEMKKDVDKTIKEHEKDKKSLERAKSKSEKLNAAEERIEEKIAEAEEQVNEMAKITGESFDLVKSKEAGYEKVEKKYKTKENKVLENVFKSHKDLLAKFHKSSFEILTSNVQKAKVVKKTAKKTTKKTKKSTKKT